tara:strand:+ start:792 stop:1205 length:414 start_codon:yes stop_codon:yes gene_type:complete
VIHYIDGIKYKLVHDAEFKTRIKLHADVDSEYILLRTNGWMLVRAGYCWDGPSGPMADTQDLMYPSLGHDALYELLRKELIPAPLRRLADLSMIDWSKETNVQAVRRAYTLAGLSLVGAAAADPKNKRKVLTAPDAN